MHEWSRFSYRYVKLAVAAVPAGAVLDDGGNICFKSETTFVENSAKTAGKPMFYLRNQSLVHQT